MKCHALLIGINTYHPLAPLSYARNDATAFKAALEAECGFDSDDITLMQCGVEGGLRVERDYIKNQLDALLLLKDLDLLIFGFWGHGFSQDGNHRYLCSISTTNTDLARTAIPLGIVNETLRQVGARNTVMILDCCQNRSIGRDSALPELEAGAQAHYAAAARDIQSHCASQSKGLATTAVLSACSEGQRAFEWDSREQGIFTAHMLDALKMGKTRLSELVDYVQAKTPLTAQQEVHSAQDPFLEMKGGVDINLARYTAPLPIVKKVPQVLRQDYFLPTLSPLLLEIISKAKESEDAHVRKYAEACESGDPDGFYFLGTAYEFNEGIIGVDESKYLRHKKALALYSKGCDLGDILCCQSAGMMCDESRLGMVESDVSKAYEFYARACELGDADTCVMVGWRYMTDCQQTKNPELASKAVNCFLKACEMGNADGFNFLGMMYANNLGVAGTSAQRNAKAMELYAKACDMGCDAACSNLEKLKRRLQNQEN